MNINLDKVADFLRIDLKRLRKQREEIRKEDPFRDFERTTDNSLEDDVDEQVGHMGSVAQANFVSKRILQFKKALARIKIGKYGICESCGKQIEDARLYVAPEATLCIKCQKESEE